MRKYKRAKSAAADSFRIGHYSDTLKLRSPTVENREEAFSESRDGNAPRITNKPTKFKDEVRRYEPFFKIRLSLSKLFMLCRRQF